MPQFHFKALGIWGNEEPRQEGQYRGILWCKYVNNRPYHGFWCHLDEKANEWEITVFVWESNIE